jgi:hypothetical protein
MRPSGIVSGLLHFRKTSREPSRIARGKSDRQCPSRAILMVGALCGLMKHGGIVGPVERGRDARVKSEREARSAWAR